MTATKSKIKFEPLPSDDPRQRQPDISKAKAILGWEPKAELREGLAKTIDYFDRMLSKEEARALRDDGSRLDRSDEREWLPIQLLMN